MKPVAIAALVATLLATGCIPIVKGKGYKSDSRNNVTEVVPAFIEAGRTSMDDVVLALGEPDTVAADESWMTFVSRYGEGGGGMILIAGGGGTAAPIGAVREKMLYRRLLIHFDASGTVTSAAIDTARCANSGTLFAQAVYSTPECFDVGSRELTLADLDARLRSAGETNIVHFDEAQWLPTHEYGVIALTDAALYFVPQVQSDKARATDVRIALVDVERVETDQSAFKGGDANLYKVVLLRGDQSLGSFVLTGPGGETISRGNDAKKKIRARIRSLAH